MRPGAYTNYIVQFRLISYIKRTYINYYIHCNGFFFLDFSAGHNNNTYIIYPPIRRVGASRMRV